MTPARACGKLGPPGRGPRLRTQPGPGRDRVARLWSFLCVHESQHSRLMGHPRVQGTQLPTLMGVDTRDALGSVTFPQFSPRSGHQERTRDSGRPRPCHGASE